MSNQKEFPWKEITSLYAWKQFYEINKKYDEVKKISNEILLKEKQVGMTLNEYYNNRRNKVKR